MVGALDLLIICSLDFSVCHPVAILIAEGKAAPAEVFARHLLVINRHFFLLRGLLISAGGGVIVRDVRAGTCDC